MPKWFATVIGSAAAGRPIFQPSIERCWRSSRNIKRAERRKPRSLQSLSGHATAHLAGVFPAAQDICNDSSDSSLLSSTCFISSLAA
jgi:hypothetical protein